MLTWLLRVLAVAATAIVLAVTGGGPAAAHSGLETSAPADGEALTAAPEAVTLSFTEAVQEPFTAGGGIHLQLTGCASTSAARSTARPHRDAAPVFRF